MPAAKDEAYGRPVFGREHFFDVVPAVERVVEVPLLTTRARR
jgi:hypothetical protein